MDKDQAKEVCKKMPAMPACRKKAVAQAQSLQLGSQPILLEIDWIELERRRSSNIDSNMSAVRANDAASMHPPLDLLRIMYQRKAGEWIITSSDGFSLKFDQAVLGAQVPHFEAIFRNKETAECRNKKIQVPVDLEMTDEDLDAFLRYIYYQGTHGMSKSFSTTCALVRAGHYYNIPKLVDSAFNVMRWKENLGAEWISYTIDEMWKLYNHVHLWEEAHPSKKFLIEHLTRAMKRIFKSEEDPDKLLTVTGGNEALRNLMMAFAK